MAAQSTFTGPVRPLPIPELSVVGEMQMKILEGLVSIQAQKAAGKPILWTSVLTPKEILYAMDVTTVCSTLLGGYVSIFGLSPKYCQVAEEDGLSRDVCAVHRCTVGLACASERDEFFNVAFATPDIVIGSNFPCMSEGKSFLQVVEKYRTPYYFLDAPINTWGAEIPEHAVAYYARQLQGMIDFLEQHGYRMDWDRLREEVAFTRKVNELLEECEVYRRASPLPLNAYDSLIAWTAPLALPRQTRTIDIFERLRDELRDRVEKGIGVVKDEKLRLLWVGVPPLCDFRLLNYPERHGAVVAKSMIEFLTGFTLDPRLMDPDRPLESIARAQLASPANPLIRGAVDYFVKAARDLRIDGVISVVKRSCGLVPGMQRITKEAIWREVSIPSIVFDLDGIDEREYDEAATKANLDAFVETLLARKGG